MVVSEWKIKTVIVQPHQPVKVPTQVGEREHGVGKETPISAVKQVAAAPVVVGVGMKEGGGVRIEVVRVGQELLKHVVGRGVEEALGGRVHV